MKPTVESVIEKVRDFYAAKPANAAGGVLHVVLDDGNMADVHILWCRHQAEAAKDQAAVDLCEELLQLSDWQRATVFARCHRS